MQSQINAARESEASTPSGQDQTTNTFRLKTDKTLITRSFNEI
jgi:hypothetical protein